MYSGLYGVKSVSAWSEYKNQIVHLTKKEKFENSLNSNLKEILKMKKIKFIRKFDFGVKPNFTHVS